MQIKETSTQRILRTAYIFLISLETAFQLFQAAGFALIKEFLRPYALALAVFSVFFIVSAILAGLKKYLPSGIFTLIASFGIAAVGYMLTHPVIEADEYYISGIDEGVFWTHYSHALLLILPAIILIINEIRRKKLEEDAKPYEKQF